MMRHRGCVAALSCLVLVWGCAREGGVTGRGEKVPAEVVTAFDGSETFVLYSLEPTASGDGTAKGVDHWTVLGQVDPVAETDRAKIVKALWKGIAESDGTMAKCFDPRHAIRVTHRGRTVDCVICFACLQAEFTEGGRSTVVAITATPQPIFDAVLSASGVPLAPKDDKTTTGPRLKAIIAIYNGKPGDSTSCSAGNFQSDGLIHPTGSMTCGPAGKASQLDWAFTGRRGDADVYSFTRSYPVGAPNVALTSKEFAFTGERIILFADDDQTLLIEGPRL